MPTLDTGSSPHDLDRAIELLSGPMFQGMERHIDRLSDAALIHLVRHGAGDHPDKTLAHHAACILGARKSTAAVGALLHAVETWRDPSMAISALANLDIERIPFDVAPLGKYLDRVRAGQASGVGKDVTEILLRDGSPRAMQVLRDQLLKIDTSATGPEAFPGSGILDALGRVEGGSEAFSRAVQFVSILDGLRKGADTYGYANRAYEHLTLTRIVIVSHPQQTF